ncbi:MAG TPA: hypothetical protein VGM90_17470 [Kofleriaceae bacterium]
MPTEPDETEKLAASNAVATAFKIWGALLALVIIGALLLPGAGRERHAMENVRAASVVIR